MENYEYAYLASTYRPPELGSAEIDILYQFVENKSQSAYDIFKKKREDDRVKRRKPQEFYDHSTAKVAPY